MTQNRFYQDIAHGISSDKPVLDELRRQRGPARGYSQGREPIDFQPVELSPVERNIPEPPYLPSSDTVTSSTLGQELLQREIPEELVRRYQNYPPIGFSSQLGIQPEVRTPEVPLSRMPFSEQIEPLGEVTPFKQIGEVMTSPEAETVKEVLGIIGAVGTLAYGGYYGVRSLIPVTKELANKTLQTSLNTGLDKWIAQRSRGVPPQHLKKLQDSLYNFIAKDRTWLQERATENMLRRMQRATNESQATKQAVEDTIRDVEQRIAGLVPKGTQSGAMQFGGLPKNVPPDEAQRLASQIARVSQELAEATDPAKQVTLRNELNNLERQKQTPTTPAETTPVSEVAPEVTPDIQNISDIIDNSVFQEGVIQSIQRDGQRVIDATRSVDIDTLNSIITKYQAEAGRGVSGGAGPTQMRQPRRGARAVWEAASRALNQIKPVSQPTPQPTQAPISPAADVTKGITPEQEVSRLAEQVKVKPPIERRAEIQSLLTEPAKNLPKGTTKITLRKELAEINKSLTPQEKKLRQRIWATAKGKSLSAPQARQIFKLSGGSRELTKLDLLKLQKVLSAVTKARPVTIRGKKVISPKTEALIQDTRGSLIEQGYLSEDVYRDILSQHKLKGDKYADAANFITESEGRGIIKAMNDIKTLAPLGELKFGKPTPVKYLTSQTYYAQILGVKPLVEPLELAKQNFDLVFRAMSHAIDDKISQVNKAWRVSIGQQVGAKIKGQPNKGVSELRDLLDKYEEPPTRLTPRQKELFNWFRNLNRTIINGENEVRRTLGVPEIDYKEAYVRHVPDKLAEEIIMGQHPIPPSLDYWSQRLVGKKIFNPMEFKRQISDDLAKLFTRDLSQASKAMVFTGLKEINLASPIKTFTQQMGALSDTMPAATRKWVVDYVNQVIKGQQTNFDAEVNRLLAEGGLGNLVNKVLKPYRVSLGRKPMTVLTNTISKGTIYSVMSLPRPGLIKLMIRNMFQRTQELALHGVTPTLTSFLPDPPTIKELKKDSMFLKSYTGIEEWPSGLMGKLGKIPLAPYQATAVLNADRAMSIAYYDYLKLFTNPKYKSHGWASPERNYKEPNGFLYPDEKKLMLEEMEWSAGATQYQYIALGMPEIFRNKTLSPITRFQSWWMNHLFRFNREAAHRLFYGESTRHHGLPWSMRLNYLKWLALGGAILSVMGYKASYLWKSLPHDVAPFGQVMLGLWHYGTADTETEREEGLKEIYGSWKAVIPGFLAYDEFRKFWSGEKPLWQLFFFGTTAEGPPPHLPGELPLGDIPPSIEKLGKEDAEVRQRALDKAETTNDIAKIMENDYIHTTQDLGNDIRYATRGLSKEELTQEDVMPLVKAYWDAQEGLDSYYDQLADDRYDFRRDNPQIDADLIIWKGLETFQSREAENIVNSFIATHNIPREAIDIFRKETVRETPRYAPRIPTARQPARGYSQGR